MKVNEIHINARDGFNMKVEKSGISDWSKLVIEYRGTEIIVESDYHLIKQAIEQALEYIDFYEPKGVKLDNGTTV